jgi:hypothetical protein
MYIPKSYNRIRQKNLSKEKYEYEKKILSMVLALCMVLTMMPVPTMAVDDVEYKIWVGGIQVTSANKDNITGGGITGTVSYDPITSTLTLNNENISSAYNTTGYNDTVCIYSEANTPLILNLVGENIITGVNAVQSSYGIRCSRHLTIEGKGSLSVTSGKGGGTNYDSSAILTQGGLIIKNTTLDVRGEKYGLFGYINSNIGRHCQGESIC